jgi:hypothetical protein
VTDDINTYTFDFEREVQRLTRELGPKADKILFVDIDIVQPDDGGKPKAVPSHVIAGRLIDRYHVSRARESIIHSYTREPKSSSRKESIMSGDVSVGNAVIINNNAPINESLGAKNEHLMLLFSIHHEAGHALIPRGDIKTDEDHPLRECEADAYAALQLLRRFGKEALPFLSMVSWYRSYEAIVYGTGHLSTTVLDRIILDAASRDFSTLTSAAIIKQASAYAKVGTPTAEMLQEARGVFKQAWDNATHPHSAHLAIETILRHRSQLACYIGAKYFDPYMHPNGIDFNNESLRYDSKTQKNYRKLIKKNVNRRNVPDIARLLGPKAAPSLLRRIFSRRARKSFTKFLQVSVPAAQERFIFARPLTAKTTHSI